jgi:APA family basic amino acid/polyamine antiporter
MRAMVLMFIATSCIGLLTDLGIFSNFLSISTLFIFMLVTVT